MRILAVNIMKYLLYVLAPILVLIFVAALACIFGYVTLLVLGDVASLGKLIGKIAKLFLVLSVFPLMHFLDMNKRDLGFAVAPRFLKQLLQGLGLGVLTLAPILLFLYALDVNIVDNSQPWTAPRLTKKVGLSLLLALLIAFAEEPVFRGILFTHLKRKMPILAVILISSGYYAWLHFMSPHSPIPYDEMTFFSGFILLGEALLNVFHVENISPFLALLMVGIFLAILRSQIRESLGLCIGVHAGWVWLIMAYKSLLNINHDSAYLFLISQNDAVIGPLVAVWMLLASVLAYCYCNRKNRREIFG